jgi:hypothetical protein
VALAAIKGETTLAQATPRQWLARFCSHPLAVKEGRRICLLDASRAD